MSEELTIADIAITPLSKFPNPKGDVYHALKKSGNGFDGFGEAYFSTIKQGVVKGWHKHVRMTMNLVMPVGCAVFVIYDDREDSETRGHFNRVEISFDNYRRLTIPPGLWAGFKGMSEQVGLILNVSNIEYDDSEVLRLDLDRITYDWDAL